MKPAAMIFPAILTAIGSQASARTWIVALDGSGDLASVATACDTASAGDSIVIRPGVYREEGHDDPYDPEIVLREKPLTILGDGPAESVSLQMKFGFVDCNGLVLSNVRLHDVTGAILDWGGSYTVRSCVFEDNANTSYGGAAILSYGGPPPDRLTVEDCVFRRNRAFAWDGEGGAIWATRMTLRRCLFKDNQAAHEGGAVYAFDLIVEDCLFIRNSAPNGAAVVMSGEGTVLRSTFYRNDCLDGMGGAIYVK